MIKKLVLRAILSITSSLVTLVSAQNKSKTIQNLLFFVCAACEFRLNIEDNKEYPLCQTEIQNYRFKIFDVMVSFQTKLAQDISP